MGYLNTAERNGWTERNCRELFAPITRELRDYPRSGITLLAAGRGSM